MLFIFYVRSIKVVYFREKLIILSCSPISTKAQAKHLSFRLEQHDAHIHGSCTFSLRQTSKHRREAEAWRFKKKEKEKKKVDVLSEA